MPTNYKQTIRQLFRKRARNTLNSCNGKIIIPFEDFPHILLLFFRLPSILEVKHNGAVVQRQGKFFQTRFGQFRSDEKP